MHHTRKQRYFIELPTQKSSQHYLTGSIGDTEIASVYHKFYDDHVCLRNIDPIIWTKKFAAFPEAV